MAEGSGVLADSGAEPNSRANVVDVTSGSLSMGKKKNPSGVLADSGAKTATCARHADTTPNQVSSVRGRCTLYS